MSGQRATGVLASPNRSSGNRRRGLLLVVAAGAIVAIVVALLTVVVLEAWALPLALLAGVMAASSLWRAAGHVASGLAGARPATEQEHPRLHNLVDGLCAAGGVAKPAVLVVQDAGCNAFTAGRDAHGAAVGVTTGLLGALSRIELEAVLARQLAQVRQGDLVAVTVAAALPLPAGLRARVLQWAAAVTDDAAADVQGVALTRYPPGLIAALGKLDGSSTAVATAPLGTGPLWLADPVPSAPGGSTSGRTPLDERIAALQEL